MSTYSYGEYTGGPDPLILFDDLRIAVDAISEAVLSGCTLEEALEDLLKRSLLSRKDRRALNAQLRQIADRKQQICALGRLDGILEQVQFLVSTATGQERDELSSDPGSFARAREASLNALPADTPHAIRQLEAYDWHSVGARQTFQHLREILLVGALDMQFNNFYRALKSQPVSDNVQRIKKMLSDLNALLVADLHGESVYSTFSQFRWRYADLYPGLPGGLEELADSLLTRTFASETLLRTLSLRQRGELVRMIAGALDSAGIAAEMTELARILRARRPPEERILMLDEVRLSGDELISLSEAISAIEDLNDLAALEGALDRSNRDEIEEQAALRLLDMYAVGNINDLGRIMHGMEQQGYLSRENGNLHLSPMAVRRLGDNSLRQIFADINRGQQSGNHDQLNIGQGGDATGSTRPWEFGDDQPLDIPATLKKAMLRGKRLPIQIIPQDFEVAQTERRTGAAISLLVDMSYSMPLRGVWAAAKQTALALLSLLRSSFPRDVVQIVGFSNSARELDETELAGLSWDMVQGTNLHHALLMAGRHIDKHRNLSPIVMIVTDGEPSLITTGLGNQAFPATLI
jgi:uncharacterized protein with von Willebrand factor type A (vWA) domain